MHNFTYDANCPACGHHVAVAFFDGGKQPLATIAWPSSMEAAASLPLLALQFVRCVDCGHIFNKKFDYRKVPYSEKPNLMFNSAVIWKTHLSEVCKKILAVLPKHPTIVEIGCGEGHLLNLLASLDPEGCFIGFDPNSEINNENKNIKFYQELFEPTKHLEMFRPDMVISRHVLEHLMNPLKFLQRLSFASEWLKLQTHLFLEVPCVDRVFESGRVADFYYEHNSHFTTQSFKCLLENCSKKVLSIEHGYNGEVISGIVQMGEDSHKAQLCKEALDFYAGSNKSRKTIMKQLDELANSGLKVAIWGGTGKSAAFINFYSADAQRFPVVIDSDISKVGTFVPGAGQLIRFRDYLNISPADVIVIPTQWRVKDIIVEMQAHNIKYKTVLIEHDRMLIDYFKVDHPYI